MEVRQVIVVCRDPLVRPGHLFELPELVERDLGRGRHCGRLTGYGRVTK